MSHTAQWTVLCVGPKNDFDSTNRFLLESARVLFEPTIGHALTRLQGGEKVDMIAIAAEAAILRGTACIETLRQYAPRAHFVLFPGCCESGARAGAESACPAPEPQLGNPHGARVLVVDDDPFVVQLFSKILEDAGYQVITASNGAEALRRLLDDGAQIVISDWTMPVMDGIELCRAIRADESIGFVYFLVVTAVSDRGRVVEAFDAGADDYITKPFDRQELLIRMRAGNRIVALEADVMRRNREVHKTNAEMAILNNKLQCLATTDELTGLANRRQAMEKLNHLFKLARRYNLPISCTVLDVDRFKSVNDTHGHAAGDAVLRSIGRQLSAAARATDVVARIGGEEFLVLTPNTNAENALILAERIRASVASNAIVCGETSLNVTISLGIADATQIDGDAAMLIRAADEAMYEAKQTGRNRTIVYKTAIARKQEAALVGANPVNRPQGQADVHKEPTRRPVQQRSPK